MAHHWSFQYRTAAMQLLIFGVLAFAELVAAVDVKVEAKGGNVTSGFQYGIMFEVSMRSVYNPTKAYHVRI
jgi:hypothetical protein